MLFFSRFSLCIQFFLSCSLSSCISFLISNTLSFRSSSLSSCIFLSLSISSLSSSNSLLRLCKLSLKCGILFSGSKTCSFCFGLCSSFGFHGKFFFNDTFPVPNLVLNFCFRYNILLITIAIHFISWLWVASHKARWRAFNIAIFWCLGNGPLVSQHRLEGHHFCRSWVVSLTKEHITIWTATGSTLSRAMVRLWHTIRLTEAL